MQDHHLLASASIRHYFLCSCYALFWIIFSQFDVCSKLFRIRATILQDEEEKVVVEESFQSRTLIDGEEERKEDSLGDSASSDYERWIIKLEQSINIFLTVYLLLLFVLPSD